MVDCHTSHKGKVAILASQAIAIDWLEYSTWGKYLFLIAEMGLFYPGCQSEFFLSEAAIVIDEAATVSERYF